MYLLIGFNILRYFHSYLSIFGAFILIVMANSIRLKDVPRRVDTLDAEFVRKHESFH